MRAVLVGLVAALLAACASPGGSAPSKGTVLLFGGSSGTGLEVAKVLAKRGDDVTVFVRPTSDRSGLDPLGVNTLSVMR